HAVQRGGAVGGDRLALALRRPRDGLVGTAEEDRCLLERPLPRARLGAGRPLGEPARPNEEPGDVGRHRLPAAGRLLEAPIEGTEQRRDALLRLRGRAGDARARAHAAFEARVAGRPALRGRRLEAVGGAGVGDAVAALGQVARTCRRAAHGGALRVGRAGCVVAGAGLGEVTLAGRRATLDAGGPEGIGRAGGAGAGARRGDVAGLRGVTWTRRRTADVRALRVGRARRVLARAELGDVARPRNRPAFDGRGRELVLGAVGAVAGAELAHVAHARCGAALGARPL